MLRFLCVFAVTAFLSSCVTETVVRDESYVKEKNHFEKYGPEYKFVSSGEIVPDGDKLAAAHMATDVASKLLLRAVASQNW